MTPTLDSPSRTSCTAIAAYLGGCDTFDRAILEFSNSYADQNERDHARLEAAVMAGTITATTGL